MIDDYEKKIRLNVIPFCDFSLPKSIKYYSFLLTNNFCLSNNNYSNKTLKYNMSCQKKLSFYDDKSK